MLPSLSALACCASSGALALLVETLAQLSPLLPDALPRALAAAPLPLVAALADAAAHACTGAAVWASALALHACASDGGGGDEAAPAEAAPRRRHASSCGLGCDLGAAVSAVAAVIAAGTVAAALDADHFLAAQSLRLSDAQSLASRPFGHAALTVAVAAAAVSAAAPQSRAGLLLACAWGSHLLRDGLRRGLWLWPLGSTPALPLPVYLAVLALAPLALAAGLARLEWRPPAAAPPPRSQISAATAPTDDDKPWLAAGGTALRRAPPPTRGGASV